MGLAAEFSADAWAARTTRQPLELARALARVAERLVTPLPPRMPAAVVLGANGSPLLVRVRRLTTDGAATTGQVSRPGVAIASLLTAIAATAALVLALPTLSFGGLAHERLERREFVVRRAATWEQGAQVRARDEGAAHTPIPAGSGRSGVTERVVQVLMSSPATP
jgi:hypothetical protein